MTNLPTRMPPSDLALRHGRMTIDGLSVFYREAGSPDSPTLVLLHGYPSSSFMFRDLMVRLADRFHLIAPDYPGFGNSDAPPPAEFEYSFDHFADIIERLLEALHLTKYSFYMQGYGAPIGFRLATKHPERVQALIMQNGNAYEEGYTPAWAPLPRVCGPTAIRKRKLPWPLSSPPGSRNSSTRKERAILTP